MTPAKKTRLYLTNAHLGGAATLGFILSQILDWPPFFQGLMVGMMMIPLAVLLLRGLRDEFIEKLWNAGTSLSFAVVVCWFLFAPFIEGVIEGLNHAPKTADWPVGSAGMAAIAAFFLGFHIKWLRSLR